jgi:hypothetical protein
MDDAINWWTLLYFSPTTDSGPSITVAHTFLLRIQTAFPYDRLPMIAHRSSPETRICTTIVMKDSRPPRFSKTSEVLGVDGAV